MGDRYTTKKRTGVQRKGVCPGKCFSLSCQILERPAETPSKGWRAALAHQEWEKWLLLGQGQAMLAQLWVQVSQEDASLHSHLLLLYVHLQETSIGWGQLGSHPAPTRKPLPHE